MYRPPPKFPMPTRKRTRPKPDPIEWRRIRTDAVVFTQLIKKFGVKGAQVEELWSVDDSIFENLRPVHGLIFLFKYLRSNGPPQPIATDERSSKVYFGKQVIRESCATQAIISLLLNCSHTDIVLGPELTKLKEFSMSFDPMMRGLILANSQALMNAHNSMAPQHLFQFDATPPKKIDDSYHFITYMTIDGHLYELDGLRDGPVHHGAVSPERDWLDLVRPIIMKRINVYTEGQIFFNLMAVVTDRKAIYESQMEQLIAETQRISIQSRDVDIEIQRLRLLIQYEDAKMEHNKQEMMRRRHNYLPFLMAFVKALSEEKKLMPLYEKAKERAHRKTAKKIKV